MKKVMAIFLVFSFLFYITSCYSYKTLTSQEEYAQYNEDKDIRIIYVKTKQGNIIEFSLKHPGKITNSSVVGLSQSRLSAIVQDSAIFKNKNVIVSVWSNGVNYEVITEDSLSFILHPSDTIKIPFSDIAQLHFRKFEKINTAVVVFGTMGLAAGIIIWYVLTQFTLDLHMGM